MPNDVTLGGPGWDADLISDETYRTKFMVLPRIIKEWTAANGGLAGKDILDFGCGEATTAIGIALRYGPRRVVGIDIGPDLEQCAALANAQLGLGHLPQALTLQQIAPGSLHDNTDRFDLIYSWSVFEHVEQRLLPATFAMLRDALKPGGVLFIQIAPLFYSAEGSHLLPWVPEPWGHLLNQHSVYCDKLAAACADATKFESLWSMYETLNRLTASQLVHHAEQARFDVLRRYETLTGHLVPSSLAEIYNDGILKTEQVVLLLKPT